MNMKFIYWRTLIKYWTEITDRILITYRHATIGLYSDFLGLTIDKNNMYVCMYVFNFFRDAILISYTAGFHEGRLFSYLQVYKNEEKTN
jgi:hypothetical protein